MNIREIIEKAIAETGADGLCNEKENCACHRDYLMSLGDHRRCIDITDCVPAKQVTTYEYCQTNASGYYDMLNRLYIPLAPQDAGVAVRDEKPIAVLLEYEMRLYACHMATCASTVICHYCEKYADAQAEDDFALPTICADCRRSGNCRLQLLHNALRLWTTAMDEWIQRTGKSREELTAEAGKVET